MSNKQDQLEKWDAYPSKVKRKTAFLEGLVFGFLMFLINVVWFEWEQTSENWNNGAFDTLVLQFLLWQLVAGQGYGWSMYAYRNWMVKRLKRKEGK